jgi:probable rRNA maturation factor
MKPPRTGMDIAVEVEDSGWLDTLPDAASLAETAAQAAWAAIPSAPGGEIAVLLTSDAEVQALNARFRGKDAATNVLSFPAPETVPENLGDIALALGVCGREAASQDKTLAAHLQHLIAHGVLHLLGYDHLNDAEAETMEAIERRIMADLGLADPYAERLDADAAHG